MNPQSRTKQTNARAVFNAAEGGDAAELSRLLASGANADERPSPGGETPLMRAAARGHEEVVRVLLDAGADPSARRADGFTPLILAVFFGHEGVVRLLVERGADASAHTGLGTTAARWAVARGFASMAEVLRAAEASRPPAAVVMHAPERKPAAQMKAAAAMADTSDEVEIFFKGRGRIGAGRGGESDDLLARASDFDEGRAGVHAEEEDSSEVTAAGVSVRREGQLPAHPSATVFRLGDFLRSWQGSLGALLLLVAFGVAVFALAQRNNAPRAAQPAPTPAPTVPQATAQQVPAPSLPTPSPTPDPLGAIPVTDQGYPAPNPTGQPFYVTTSPVNNIPSDVPRELTVVSESGTPSAQDGGQTGRRAGASASPTPAPRSDNASDAAAPRTARTPEPEEPRPAAPSNQTPPPAPQPTPRAKVIQWPPQ